jgi:hypothetical protein
MQRCSPSEDRIDERRDRAALGQNEQAAEGREQYQKRQQPEFLSRPGEAKNSMTNDIKITCSELIADTIGLSAWRRSAVPVARY